MAVALLVVLLDNRRYAFGSLAEWARRLWSDPDRVLIHFDDMGADVVASHSASCCNPMMAVENVVLTVPSPHLDGRERLTLAHGDQYAAQAGAGSLTEWPEVPVEQLRC